MSENTQTPDFFDDLTRELQRQSLRHSVGHTIFCPVTGDVLDVSNAVEVSVYNDGALASVMVVSAPVWDARRDTVVGGVHRLFPDARFEVLDGRELFPHK